MWDIWILQAANDGVCMPAFRNIFHDNIIERLMIAAYNYHEYVEWTVPLRQLKSGPYEQLCCLQYYGWIHSTIILALEEKTLLLLKMEQPSSSRFAIKVRRKDSASLSPVHGIILYIRISPKRKESYL